MPRFAPVTNTTESWIFMVLPSLLWSSYLAAKKKRRVRSASVCGTVVLLDQGVARGGEHGAAFVVITQRTGELKRAHQGAGHDGGGRARRGGQCVAHCLDEAFHPQRRGLSDGERLSRHVAAQR